MQTAHEVKYSSPRIELKFLRTLNSYKIRCRGSKLRERGGLDFKDPPITQEKERF